MDNTPSKIMALRAATGLPVLQARDFLATHPEELVDRILRAAGLGSRSPQVQTLNDPLEADPTVGPIIRRSLEEATARAQAEIGGGWQWGLCHRIWKYTKEQLSVEHGITWYSPAEMNPGACFD